MKNPVKKFITRVVRAVSGGVLHPEMEFQLEHELANMLQQAKVQPLLPFTTPVDSWPQEVGFYWFYGWMYKGNQKNEEPKWHSVRVVKGANAMINICDGALWFKTEAGEGTWYQAFLPER